ncbi:MAG: Flp pilus assembly complex ATPase component TadA [Nanoarchaeota archaeon]|nr:Flp pilus assembly complex ATPase component TadA [Nanoarchaeota archaeon]
MVVIESYDFKSGDIPINVTINKERDSFVFIYEISISKISENTELILDKILEEVADKINLGIVDITDPKKTLQTREKFRDSIVYTISKYFPDISDQTRSFFTTYLMQKGFGLGKIDLLLSDANLEEVVINNAEDPLWVYHRKHGWLKTNIHVKDEDMVKHYASLIGRKVGRSISILTPLLDAHLESGDRVNATLSPISTKGNTLTMRKFATKPLTMTDMLRTKTLSVSSASLIWCGIEFELSALVTGGTATGKTSFLGAMGGFFQPNHRIISVEDTREIRLPIYLHWIPMVTRTPNVEGKGEVTMLDLIVNSLRMRPDRIIVGEIRRQNEAETLFEAMHTGHSVYATLHANDTEETITRLINPPINVPKPMLPSISMVLVMYRNRRTGIRRVFQISEILHDGSPNVLLQLDFRKDALLVVRRNQRLMPELTLQTGLTRNEINNIMAEKGNILRWMVKNNINTVDGFGKVVATYYTDKEKLLKFIKK